MVHFGCSLRRGRIDEKSLHTQALRCRINEWTGLFVNSSSDKHTSKCEQLKIRDETVKVLAAIWMCSRSLVYPNLGSCLSLHISPRASGIQKPLISEEVITKSESNCNANFTLYSEMFYKTCPADFVANVLCIQILNKFLEDRKKAPPSLSLSLSPLVWHHIFLVLEKEGCVGGRESVLPWCFSKIFCLLLSCLNSPETRFLTLAPLTPLAGSLSVVGHPVPGMRVGNSPALYPVLPTRAPLSPLLKTSAPVLGLWGHQGWRKLCLVTLILWGSGPSNGGSERDSTEMEKHCRVILVMFLLCHLFHNLI